MPLATGQGFCDAAVCAGPWRSTPGGCEWRGRAAARQFGAAGEIPVKCGYMDGRTNPYPENVSGEDERLLG
eukprot:353229-Chlamydomonas_euryale.AAC.5